MVATFDSLPSEIQQMIFVELRDNISDIRECTLVCQSWKHFYELLLYMNVELRNFAQLKKFLNTLEKNRNLSQLVAKLVFSFQYKPVRRNREEISATAKLFTLLPNLEYFGCFYETHFSFLLDALLANQLPRLKYIKPPNTGADRRDYTACAIILKERLTNLLISDEFEERESSDSDDTDDEELTFIRQTRSCSILYHRLYDKLSQFKSIQELHIKKRYYDLVNLIEEVTHDCPTVQRLRLDRSSRHGTNAKVSNADNQVIANALPAVNINRLELDGIVIRYSQLVNYLVKKFPQLNYLHIVGSTDETALDEITFNKLWKYLTTIKVVRATCIPYTQSNLNNSIGSFWKTLSESYTLFAEFTYTNRSRDIDVMSIFMSDKRCKNNITYHSEALIKHESILENYGKYIDYLKFTGIKSNTLESSQTTSFQTLILQPLHYCTKLKLLSLENCNLDASTVSDEELVDSKTLDSLYISDCRIIGSRAVYEKLSKVFQHIKHLKILGIKLVKRAIDKSALFKRLEFTETDIDTLSLSHTPLFEVEEKTLLLVNITLENSSDYYVYNFRTMNDRVFKGLDEEEYYEKRESRECFLIRISCKSLKTLKVTHSYEEISLYIA